MTFGGYTSTGFTFSEEQKRWMSERRTGKKTRPRTAEEKMYHSLIMKEKWASEGYRKLRDEINRSEEHRRKQSESLRGERNGMFGKKHSESSRQKMSQSRSGEKNYWFGKTKDSECRISISKSLTDYYLSHSVTDETRERISKKVCVPVKQISKDGSVIATFESATRAGAAIGVDASCIIKVCKGKRKLAGGYIWEYSGQQVNPSISWKEAVESNEWLDIAEICRRTGRARNVIYYHIKHHNIPIVLNGRRRLIYFPALDKMLK